ncbi:unnamed protein product [[Candida] boidinii]|uniref:Unnamed protein product n=1 Tax=Candida boidinii TaxID=5477 RepID=A0A9W6WKB8_CANBO|nr:hypothetical protein B5S30_g5176 [[Candida] boidinii]OWB86181.1 hypothetical protein B5S33_g4863 [[Candida] boidinii]GME77714.1 unnamed protein product [[Candida] boidinii]GMG12208.1 unnamed protein product [[Candida] boidinii]
MILSIRNLIPRSSIKVNPLRNLTKLNRINTTNNIPIFQNAYNSYNSYNVIRYKSDLINKIPGESKQTNQLKDRFPTSLKLSNEAIPTLLPRPGVPRASNTMPLKKMLYILKQKQEPELIYDAEPHKLYFVFCYCFALVFFIYAFNTYSIGSELVIGMYKDNDMSLDNLKLNLQLIMNFGIVALLTLGPLIAGSVFILFPSRLIRRMWYLPGKIEHIRFTTHPMIPYRPSPVITLPLSELSRHQRSRIWTNKGFYGTNDSSFFFFVKEKGKKSPWIMDRKGFFWGDGRVFDVLFGKETIEQAERGEKFDEKIGKMMKKGKEEEKKLKKELGFGWRYKAQGKLMIEDLNKLKKIIKKDSITDGSKNGDSKSLPGGNEEDQKTVNKK